jgi:general L-amino acid transport system permease protein
MFKSTKAPGKFSGQFASDRIIPSLIQLVVVGLVISGAYFLFQTTQENLAARNIESGFDFLSHEAGFPIGDSLVSYSPEDSYGRAFVVGIINTLYSAVLCIIFATVIGVVVGVAQVSGNLLISKIAEVYVEIFRNIPALLILLFVYTVVLASLPSVRQAIELLPGTFLSQRGLYLPKPIAEDGFGYVLIVLSIALITVFFFRRWARLQQERSGRQLPVFLIGLTTIIVLPLLTYWLLGAPLNWEVPELKGFNFAGGWVFRPEFTALVVGLALYRGAFIAENVRSGIMSVHKGQLEAATALGLPPSRIMKLVVLPQALRTIIPATTNDYASLIKDSSLAIAIGYPDMVSVGGTMIGQNGQAVEVIGMWMAVYLTINLFVSVLMNFANKKFQLKER